jgi:hypothetical protein
MQAGCIKNWGFIRRIKQMPKDQAAESLARLDKMLSQFKYRFGDNP